MNSIVKSIISVACLVGLLGNMGGAWSQSISAEARATPLQPESTPTIQITSTGVSFSWDFPQIQVIQEPGGQLSVSMDGLSSLNQPGKPVLPVGHVLVAVPPQSMPVVILEELQDSLVPLTGELALAPQPDGAQMSVDGEVIAGFAPAEQAASFNPAPVEFEILGVVRGVTLGRLVFYPARPEGDQLRVATRIRGRLEFNAASGLAAAQPTTGDPLLRILASQVANPQQVPGFQRPRANGIPGVEIPSVTTAKAIVEVTQTGITSLTYNDLLSAGFPVNSVNPYNLHLAHAGTEVAIEWDGDVDVNFESNERVLFFADPVPSRWQTSDAYVLTETALPGLRMGSRSANPTGVASGAALMDLLVEQNTRYTPDCLCGSIPAGRDGDHWVWDVLKQPDLTSKSYAFSLPSVDTTQPGKLKVWFIGYTNTSAPTDHRVNVTLNGKTVTPVPPGPVEWNGKQAYTGSFDISPATLAGSNTLTLTLPGITGVSVEGMWLDAFQVRYPIGSASLGATVTFNGQPTRSAYSLNMSATTGLKAYDVTDPNNPQILTGYPTPIGNTLKLADPAALGDRRYTAAANTGIILLLPGKVRLAGAPISSAPGFNGAQYVIITHSSFTSALSPFITFRQSQGLSVLMEDVQAIYDQYSAGRMDPDAIRSFLDNAYHNWPTPPVYVLLVGDGTSDPRMYYTTHPATFIPPYLADVDAYMGETAADNRYAAVDGADILPDLLLGRWTVNTLAEAQAVVQKTMNYEQSPVPGTWSKRYTYVTDDADVAGDFPNDAEGLINLYTPPGVTVEKFYYPQGLPYNDPLAAQFRTNVKNSWNNGQALMVYIGHSSPHQWAAESIIHYNDVPNISNGGKMPVLLELTCFTTAFHTQSLQTLDETLFRRAGSAAVAVWGPSGLGLSSGHVELARGFLEELHSTSPARIGDAALAGKLNLAATISAYSDLLDTYNLLGDPYMKFYTTASPVASSIFLPLVRK